MRGKELREKAILGMWQGEGKKGHGPEKDMVQHPATVQFALSSHT
jgi:hypothetical protein